MPKNNHRREMHAAQQDTEGLERRNRERLDAIPLDWRDEGVAEYVRRIDAGLTPLRGDRAAGEAVTVATTDARLTQLSEVLETGAVMPIAYDATLFAAYEAAEPAAARYQARHPDASGREVFSRLRKGLGRNVDIPGYPVHHRQFPIREHRDDVLDPENLEVTRPGPLMVGSDHSAHDQLHEVYGDENNKYSQMVWGDVPEWVQLARWQAFQNPAATPSQDEVAKAFENVVDTELKSSK
ncbi:MAG: hypothetical protein K2Z25_25735 [Beijerinckiaceae bacterium]|nr:hypothetical protein [Beijerinckiaceae bacterium]